MKVVFVTREGRKLSGARVRCHDFARALRELGAQARVFSFADDLGAEFGEREARMGVSRKLALNLEALKRLPLERGTIVVMQRLNYHTPAPFLRARIKGCRFVFDCDDWNIRENPAYHFGFWPSSKMEFATRRLAVASDLCVAASGYLKEYLSRFAKNVVYLPTGVDTGAFAPVTAPGAREKFVFSWIGTAYHREMEENLRFVIDCFSLAAGENREVFLELAGEGAYYDSVRRDPRLPCRDRIIFRGWLPPELMPGYLAEIDAGLLPLIQDSRFNRAKSPTKLFEYMASGRPTVSSRTGEACSVIRDGADGFLAGTKEEFAGAMSRLAADRALCRGMGENARVRAEDSYSLRVLGKRLHGYLERLA